jgi:outer membrane biosynthesis protein TonB
MREDEQWLDLPFVKRRKDVGTAVYDHRAGIFLVVIAALAVAVMFVVSKIRIYTPPEPVGAIVLDMRSLEELAAEKARLEREVRLRQSALETGPARNAVSNEGAELSDDRGGAGNSDLMDKAEGARQRMDANRDAWDEGLRQVDEIGRSHGEKAGSNGSDARVKGRVLVSFSLMSPVRYSDRLEVPGYRCEGGGEVVVDITVSRDGSVVAASINRGMSTNDACMHSTGLEAAKKSRFNIDSSAPERQAGTIAYTFVPQ